MTLQSSQMGRGGHRDDRRRRLLSEDLAVSSGVPAPNGAISLRNGLPNPHKSANYGAAEFLQTQPRLTDLIPRRLVAYAFFLLVGLSLIAGLTALYLWIPGVTGRSHVQPIMADLGNYGSLGNWFGSLLLLLSGILTVLIYSVRRHRVDDYHGRYHIWLWAAACSFMMATDVAAGLHPCFQGLMITLTGSQIVGDGSIWWVLPTSMLVATIGSRLLIDMRVSRLSSTALILSGIAYSTALTFYYHRIHLQSEVYHFLFMECSLLGGHLLFAVSMGLYARFVVLDAEGLLPRRVARKKAGKKRAASKSDKAAANKADARVTTSPAENEEIDAEEEEEKSNNEESADKWLAVDPPHDGTQPILKRVATTETSSGPPLGQRVAALGSGNSNTDASLDESKLSKADRKALKKKLIDERLKREQRKAANW